MSPLVPVARGRVTPTRRSSRRCCLWALVLLPVGVVVLSMLSFALAMGGGLEQCSASDRAGGPGPAGPPPSRSAVQEIPADRLAIYRRAGRALNIDWTFLASVGAQECGHRTCPGTNGSGCAGPMQIAVRRGSPCSPGTGPTLWDRYKTDGNHDGRHDVDEPADAIFTAAKILRREKHAPATGGTYAAYRRAACAYYGACADGAANYADEVMRRAIQYGFRGHGSPQPTDPRAARPAADLPTTTGGSCGGAAPVGPRTLGTVQRLRAPRRLASLPAAVIAPGFGAIRCDARIVPDVVFLMRRFGTRVTACQSIHSLAGEHPLGAAVDVVPGPSGGWSAVERLARALGWKPSCAASGVAPACARPPFRFLGYNGFPSHGDPAHCVPCGGGPHLHISWQTSASAGGSENRPRTSYFAPPWIDVLERSDDAPVGATNG